MVHSKELVCSEEASCSVSLQKWPVESKMQLVLLSHGAVDSLVGRPYPTRSCQPYQYMVSQIKVGPWKSMAVFSRCLLCPTPGNCYPHFGQPDWPQQKGGGGGGRYFFNSSLCNDLTSSWVRTAEELASCSQLSGLIRTGTSWATFASEGLVLSSRSKAEWPSQQLPW